MQERSEEQIISRLMELENDDRADRRDELTDQRFLSLIHDPDDGRTYILRHRLDGTEGAEIPVGTEFFEFPAPDAAADAYDQLLAEARQAGELVQEDSDEGIGDFESAGAEVRDQYSDSDDDLLIPRESEDPDPLS